MKIGPRQSLFYAVIGLTTVTMLVVITVCGIWLGKRWKHKRKKKNSKLAREKSKTSGQTRKETKTTADIIAAQPVIHKEGATVAPEKCEIRTIQKGVETLDKTTGQKRELLTTVPQKVVSKLSMLTDSAPKQIGPPVALMPNRQLPPTTENLPALQAPKPPPMDGLTTNEKLESRVRSKPEEGGSLIVVRSPRKREKSKRRKRDLLTSQKGSDNIIRTAKSTDDLDKDLRVLLSDVPRKRASDEILALAKETVNLEILIRSTITKDFNAEKQDAAQA